MQETRVSNEMWTFCLRTLLLILIIAAVVWSEYHANQVATWLAICVGGCVLWFLGFALAGKGALANRRLRQEFVAGSGELCPREFYFNGSWFQPYEQHIKWPKTVPIVIDATIKPGP